MKSLKLRHSIESFGTIKAKPGDIRIEALETRLSPRVAFPHRHDFFHLILITQGAGWHEIDFTRHKVGAKTAFLMKPGQVHAWQMNPKTRGFVIEFTGESIRLEPRLKNELLHKLGTAPDSWVLKAQSFAELAQMSATLLREAESKNELLLSSLLCAWSAMFVQSCTAAATSNAPKDLIEKFKHLLDASIFKEHGVSYYAKELGMTPKALTNQVVRHLGLAPRTILQERLSLEAKRMLAYSDQNVGEVAEALGFDDFNYFARFFKKQTGQSPSDFRKKVRR